MTTLTKRIITAQREDHRRSSKDFWSDGSAKLERRIVTLEGTVTLQVDVERLMRWLGTKALAAKTKRAQEASGAIVAVASEVRELVATEWGPL